MTTTISTLSPKRTFEDNMRPATLLLQIFRLLNCEDRILTEGEIVDALRSIIGGSADEELMVVWNGIFMGLVREQAQLPRSTLRQSTLCHLLRQAVVASCGALDAYLPALLRANLPLVITARGRDFVPPGDKMVRGHFTNLTFDLDDALRLASGENPAEYIADKILRHTNFAYLSNERGVHVVGALLGLPDPWGDISERLGEEKGELTKVLRETVRRRNDIVHRADRAQDDPGGEVQTISFSWTQRAVDTIHHIGLALDELVMERMSQIRAMLPE